jgi:serine/threonine-protein kinase
MEFVEGSSLEDVLEQGPVPWERAGPLMLQAARAVAYLHARQVRHRDIKPANFLVRRDQRLKLVDFGLAMEADISRITQQGMAFGTVSYSPPEWINPEKLDPASWDIYSLGVVCWEILTGEVAFPVSGQGSGRQQVMQVIVGKQGHAPLDPGERCPDEVRELIRRMTHSDPKERLPSMADAVSALEDLVGSAAISGFSDVTDEHSIVTSAPTPGVPPVRKHSHGAETWTEEVRAPAPAAPPQSRGVGFMIGAMLITAVAVGGVGFALAVGLGWYQLGGGGRAVEIALTGLPADLPVDVQVGDLKPTSGSGHTLRYRAVTTGDYDVRWVVGDGCTLAACADGDCPPWCGRGSSTIAVEFGTGRQVVTLQAEAPRGK